MGLHPPINRDAQQNADTHVNHHRHQGENINDMLMLMSRHMAIDKPTGTGDDGLVLPPPQHTHKHTYPSR